MPARQLRPQHSVRGYDEDIPTRYYTFLPVRDFCVRLSFSRRVVRKKILLHMVDCKDMVLLPGQSKENTIFSLSDGLFEVLLISGYIVGVVAYLFPAKMAGAPSRRFRHEGVI